MLKRLIFVASLFLIMRISFAQNYTVSGFVKDRAGNPLQNATIRFDRKGGVSNEEGEFSLSLKNGKYEVRVSYVGYQSRDTTVIIDKDLFFLFTLDLDENLLDEIVIRDVDNDQIVRPDVNQISLDRQSAVNFPSAFGDFSRVLVTLPGVASNNELSSGYSVRGGNFDENLVYVNDIPVYRPFLSNAGQQEGLSFVNPDLVKDISFYAGGWEAKYGDKLSSNLLIEYKTPASQEGSLGLGLLGGSGYYGNSTKNDRINYVIGVRHRDSRYLLNTLEVSGQYFPTYSDIQSLITFDLTDKQSNQTGKTTINWLNAYSRNRYLTLPASQVTEFGSVSANLRIQTAFQGREMLDYDTYQSGFRLVHRFSNRFSTSFIASGVYTREVENYDVEGAYRLCDVDNNPGSSSFEECVSVRGAASQIEYGRNKLEATIVTGENRYEWYINDNHMLEAGAGVSWRDIDDELNEYALTDSADFISVDYQAFNELAIENVLAHQFIQWEYFSSDSIHVLNAGIRNSFWSQNNQWMVSPRLQYQLRPAWEKAYRFNFSGGVYQQAPLYRELRERDGSLNQNRAVQKSIHLIAGVDRFLTFWNRPFLFSTQVYYKYLYDLIPFEIDNVRLRYFGGNNSTGYSTGFDMRINGEFIPGTQSWFSLGYLKSVENIPGDSRGNIRRPLDQRLNLGVYFEDYMPLDSTIKVYVNLVFGSGYPVGPPGDLTLRNIFSGDEYYRADIGLSKEFSLNSMPNIEKMAVRVEVLNAFAADNTLSYTWIQDVTGTSFAIPNSLSARFFNLKFLVYL